MNRNAFTLIEVLVSVAILAVVATGLFEIATNSKNNFAYLLQKSQFDRVSSIPIIHNDPKFNHSTKDLYEYLRNDYDIREDSVRKTFKDIRVTYTQEEYAVFAPFADAEEKTGSDETDTLQQNVMDMQLVFDKITISDTKNSTYVYKLQKR